MDNLPRQILRELIAEYGTRLCDDPRRVEAMLKDLCNQCKLEINVLVNALKVGIASELQSANTRNLPESLFIPKLVNRLHETYGTDINIARWAVESWRVVLVEDKEYRGDNHALPSRVKVDNFADAEAQYNLAVKLINGDGVAKDEAKAAECFRKAAEQNHAAAQTWLGVLYQKGQGVTQNYAEAAKWYRKAAKQGYCYGQYNLGVSYQNG